MPYLFTVFKKQKFEMDYCSFGYYFLCCWHYALECSTLAVEYSYKINVFLSII